MTLNEQVQEKVQPRRPEDTELPRIRITHAYAGVETALRGTASYDLEEVHADLAAAVTVGDKAAILVEVLTAQPALIEPLETYITDLFRTHMTNPQTMLEPAQRGALIDLALAEWKSWLLVLERDWGGGEPKLIVNDVIQDDIEAILKVRFSIAEGDSVLHLLSDICNEGVFFQTKVGIKQASIYFEEERPEKAYFCVTDDLDNDEYRITLRYVSKSRKILITPHAALKLLFIRSLIKQEQTEAKKIDKNYTYEVRCGELTPLRLSTARRIISDTSQYYTELLSLQREMRSADIT